MIDHDHFGFLGHRVNDKPAAEPQCRPSLVERFATSAPADEGRMRLWERDQHSRRHTVHHRKTGNTKRFGIPADPLHPIEVALDGDGSATRVGAQPLDRDRRRTRTDIPQHLARSRHQVGQR